MKKRWLILLLAIVAVIAVYFLAPWDRWAVEGAAGGGKVLGAETVLASRQALASLMNEVSANAARSAKKGLVQELAQVLGVTDAGNNAPIGQSGGEQTTRSGYAVCTYHAVHEVVSYLLQAASATGTPPQYLVDWGDGTIVRSQATHPSSTLRVTHDYSLPGRYTIVFKTLSGSIFDQKEACVQ